MVNLTKLANIVLATNLTKEEAKLMTKFRGYYTEKDMALVAPLSQYYHWLEVAKEEAGAVIMLQLLMEEAPSEENRYGLRHMRDARGEALALACAKAVKWHKRYTYRVKELKATCKSDAANVVAASAA